MRILHLLCDEGITGELWLAALVDAGAEPAELQATIDAAGVAVQLEAEPVEARHVRAARVRLVTGPDAPRLDRAAQLHDAVDTAGLAPRAEKRAHAIIDALVRAEAAVHGVDPVDVRLHELGRARTAAGIVAGAAALEALDVDRVTVGPVAVGDGSLEIDHGRFPVPPPAVLQLLAGFTIEGGGRRQELTTPSGAAVLAALAEPVTSTPRLRLEAHGRGVSGEGAAQRLLTLLVGEQR